MPTPEVNPIAKSIVFVLGAGASVPYGFPSGPGLVDALVHNSWEAEVVREMSDAQRSAFVEKDKVAREAILSSRLFSIDEFLRSRSDLIPWGKRAVALRILQYERATLANRFQPGLLAQDWMRLLWNQLKAKPEVFVKHKVAFVTLNYDRFIEHYLTSAMASSFGISTASAWDAVSRLKFVHLHGSVGPYAADSHCNDGVTFGESFSWSAIGSYSSEFRLWWEEEASNSRITEAYELLAEADYVVALGIGHAAPLLKPLSKAIRRPNCKRFVTAFGMEALEALTLERVFGARTTAEASIDSALLIRKKIHWDALR